jgi:putative transposase
VLPDVIHDNNKWQNNRAENSHQPNRQQERQMRRFKSPGQVQRLFSAHGRINNLFRLGRYHMKAAHYRLFRYRAFALWQGVTCVQNVA